MNVTSLVAARGEAHQLQVLIGSVLILLEWFVNHVVLPSVQLAANKTAAVIELAANKTPAVIDYLWAHAWARAYPLLVIWYGPALLLALLQCVLTLVMIMNQLRR